MIGLFAFAALFGFAFLMGAFDFSGSETATPDDSGDTDRGDTGSTNQSTSGTTDGQIDNGGEEQTGDQTGDMGHPSYTDVAGTSGDDVLTSTTVAEHFSAGAGDDFIAVGDGDLVDTGDGADTVHVEVSGAVNPDDPVPQFAISDFDPAVDRIEIDISTWPYGSEYYWGLIDSYDPGSSGATLAVEDWADGAGADVLFNGTVVASIAGAQGLSADQIDFSYSDHHDEQAWEYSQQVGTDGADVFEAAPFGIYTHDSHWSDPYTVIRDFDPTRDHLLATLTLGNGEAADLSIVATVDGTGSIVFGNTLVVGVTPDQLAGLVQLDITSEDDQAIALDGSAFDDRIVSSYAGVTTALGEGDDHARADGLVADGGAGNDTLVSLGVGALDGGLGEDILVAAAGSTLTGGSGADSFTVVYDVGVDDTAAIITDFNPGQETLTLSLTGAGTVSVADWIDGLGATVSVDGVAVAEVAGGAGLTAADIVVSLP